MESFIRNRLSPLITEAYRGVMGLTYTKEKGQEILYITYTDATVISYDITGKTKSEVANMTLEKAVFYE